MDSNITNLIFDFVGRISNIFKILSNTYYTKHKDEIIKINKYIINDNQEIITSNVKVQGRMKYFIN